MSIIEIIISVLIVALLGGFWAYISSYLSLILPNSIIIFFTIAYTLCCINFIIGRRK